DDLAWQGLAGHLAGSFLGVRWVFVAIFVWKKLSSTGRAIKSGDSLVQAPVDDTRGNRSRSERSRHTSQDWAIPSPRRRRCGLRKLDRHYVHNDRVMRRGTCRIRPKQQMRTVDHGYFHCSIFEKEASCELTRSDRMSSASSVGGCEGVAVSQGCYFHDYSWTYRKRAPRQHRGEVGGRRRPRCGAEQLSRPRCSASRWPRQAHGPAATQSATPVALTSALSSRCPYPTIFDSFSKVPPPLVPASRSRHRFKVVELAAGVQSDERASRPA